MHRRMFLAFPLASSLIATSAAGQQENRLDLGSMTFLWQHKMGRLFGQISAPAGGWFAVGFNDEPLLKGTRFLIAAIHQKTVRAEIHIAVPPDHHPVEKLGGWEDIQNLEGSVANGRSHLSFSLPEQSMDRFAVDLAPGRLIHLMLAWSNELDFTHHSAWRRHADVVL